MIGKDFVITSGYFEGYTQATSETWAIDTSDPAATWRRMDDIPIELGVTHAATVIVGYKMYVIGGYLSGNWGTDGVGQEVADVVVYNHAAPAGQQWSRLPDLPQGRAGGGAFYDAKANALLFSAGCIRPFEKNRYAEDQDDTWAFYFNNPGAGWVRKADSLIYANHLQYTTAIDSKGKPRHFIMGGQLGQDEHDGNIGEMYEYSFEANQWYARADMPIPRSHASSSTRAYGCGFLIISGTTNAGQRVSDISYYDPEADKWTSIGEVPTGLNTPVCDINTVNGEDWLFCETGWTATDYSYKTRIGFGP